MSHISDFPDNVRIIFMFSAAKSKISFLKGGKVSRVKPRVNNHTSSIVQVHVSGPWGVSEVLVELQLIPPQIFLTAHLLGYLQDPASLCFPR